MKPRRLVCLFTCLTTVASVIFLGALAGFLWRTWLRDWWNGRTVPTPEFYGRLYQQILHESNLDEELLIRFNDPRTYEWRALQWMFLHDGDRPTNQPLLQRFALATICLSFDIEVEVEHECDWKIVNCTMMEHSSSSVVVSLDLTSVPIVGTMPNSLRFLSHLEKLDMTNQNLKGSLPSIHHWTHLRELLLANNHLSSVGETTLPKSIEVLDLSDNYLDHGLPSFTSLQRLRYLNLRGNSRLTSDTLLNELHWSTLTYLNIAETSISGSLPEGADYSQLQVLAAGYTPLVGTLPESLADASHLEILQLGITASSNLTGTLPGSYERLTRLEQLSIVRTELTGTLPVRWGQTLTQLRALDLYENPGLIGSIPDDWNGLTSMEILRVVDTGLSGTFPSFFSQWNKLQSLSLHRTALSGTMPSAICQLPALTSLTANCGGDDPEVDCACCTFCWYRGGD